MAADETERVSEGVQELPGQRQPGLCEGLVEGLAANGLSGCHLVAGYQTGAVCTKLVVEVGLLWCCLGRGFACTKLVVEVGS